MIIFFNAIIIIFLYIQLSKKIKLRCSDIYAFVRVRNEEYSLRSSLNTLLPYINKGVIAFNDNTDKSESIILKFCNKYPNFLYLKYTHKVIPVSSKLYMYKQHYLNRLDGYYNTALLKIPSNQWLFKADADELYNSFLIRNLTCNIDNKKKLICMPRINLYLINCTFFALKKHYLVDPCDQWLFLKSGKEKFKMYINNSSKHYYAYELLMYGNKKIMHFNKISILHLSHINSDIEKKYKNNEMIQFMKLVESKHDKIIVNSKMILELKKLERKCKNKIV